MFKIIGADGKEYGPVSREQVRQWIREGRANARTQVQTEGAAEWIALGEVIEFEDVLGRKPEEIPPVGAFSPLPADVLERDYDLDIGACVSQGADLVKNKFGVVFGVSAIYLLIQGAIQGLGAIPFVGPIFGIGSLFVLGQLLAGVYLVILKTQRGQASDVGELFVGFKTAYVQLLLTYIVCALLTMLAAMPGMLLLGVPMFLMIQRETVDVVLLVLSVVGFILMLIPLVYLSTVWLFSLPLVIDKGLGFWQAMETSRKVVNTHWFSVFGLVVVIGLVNLVGILLCCIGVFLSFPVGIAAMMCAYETLFSPREAHPS